MPTQNIFDLVDTWASGGGPYTSIKMNATDNDSGSASLLMDLQVGTVSQIGVAKAKSRIFGVQSDTGGVSISTTATSTSFLDVVGGSTFHYVSGNIVNSVNRGGTKGFSTTSDGFFSWGSTTTSAGNPGDLLLTRRGIANLRLGAADAASGVQPQTLSVQSITGTNASAAAYPFKITGAQGTGNAAGGSIIFQVAPAGGAGAAQNTLVDALTINSAQQALFSAGTASAPSLAFAARTNQGFYDGGGYLVVALGGQKSATFGTIQGATTGAVTVPSGGGFAFSSTSDADGALDTYLRRDAANTLALRNGTNAQAFRVYNTWTSFGSGTEIWERGNIFWDSNVLKIGTEKGANGGTARELEFQTNGTTKLTITTTAGSAKFGQGPNGQFGWYNTYGNLVFEAYESSSVRKFVLNGLLLFEGVSSSFPAIKRSSTTLQARLADDSAFAPVQGKLTTDTAYTAGTIVATGYLTLYDSTGTAYRVPCVV